MCIAENHLCDAMHVHCDVSLSLRKSTANQARITAGFLYRPGAETPPKLSNKISSLSQNDFEIFLSGGYPNCSSGIHRWGLDLSTWYPNTYFSWLSGYTLVALVFLPGDKIFGHYLEMPVTKIRVSAPSPYINLAVTGCWHHCECDSEMWRTKASSSGVRREREREGAN